MSSGWYCQATGTGTWDLGPGTWDLGPGTWDLGPSADSKMPGGHHPPPTTHPPTTHPPITFRGEGDKLQQSAFSKNVSG